MTRQEHPSHNTVAKSTKLLRVGMGQLASIDSKTRNRQDIARISEEFARAGANYVVFPEFADFFSSATDDMSRSAEPRDGDFVDFLVGLSVSLDIAISAGYVEQRKGLLFSTVATVQGSQVTHQQKLHLYSAFGGGEGAWLSPGSEEDAEHSNLIAQPSATIGVTVCYDLRFSEVSLQRRRRGAQVLIVPSAWYPGPNKKLHWENLLRARAIENQMWVIGIGQALPSGIGTSRIFNPLGRTTLNMGRGPESTIATLDPDLSVRIRRANDMQAARAARSAT